MHILRISIVLAIGGSALAAKPTDFLPPAPVWSGASESLIADPDDPWITPAERMGLADSPSYDETMAWLGKLCQASPLLHLEAFGQTPQGRNLVFVIASRASAHSARSVRKTGKPILLAQAGIHSGEIDGKDAGLMLLRDLAFRDKGSLLDHASLLFVPIFSADGHERRSAWNRPNQRGPVHQGWRATAQNLNLNRDYAKADSPEMRAMLKLIRKWRPSLALDLHVTDGVDYQYDITFGYNGDHGSECWSPRIARWLENRYRPIVSHSLRTAGHIPGHLIFAADNRDITAGLNAGPSSPRFSHGYGDLRHLPTVLVENHSLKPYRQRVLGAYVLLEASLRALGQHAEELDEAIQADASARPTELPANHGGDGTVRADWNNFLGIESKRYVSPASGVEEVRWTGKPCTYPSLPVYGKTAKVKLSRPKAYWIPPTKPQVIDRLQVHGIKMERLEEPRTFPIEMYRLRDPRVAPMPYEGRQRVTTGIEREKRAETFPAGSVRVPTDQSLGDLAVLLLEPESEDSLLAWGFFPEILQRTEYIEGYVIAPLAEHMLETDEGIREAFEQRLKQDESFENDPRARLRWFYERSRFYDDRYLLYPIGIER